MYKYKPFERLEKRAVRLLMDRRMTGSGMIYFQHTGIRFGLGRRLDGRIGLYRSAEKSW